VTDTAPSPGPAEDAVTGPLDAGPLDALQSSEDSPHGEPAGAMAMIEETEGLLGDVEAALERLESGQYRICEICGAPLDAATLVVEPTLRRCLAHTA
jgi:RNA polymerase-binding transcription factor DksA